MKYNVGDRVRVKSLDWYNENKDKYGFVDFSTSVFVPGMSQFCGKIVTIEDVFEEEDGVVYCMEGIDYDWTDEMIEGLVEDTITTNEQLNKQMFVPSNISLEKEMEWNLPNGYIFKDENGNEILTSKIILEKKKKEYPKTYEECARILGFKPYHLICNKQKDSGDYVKNLSVKLECYRKLIVCRDAYWKIAGWEPDWTDLNQDKFVFIVEGNTLMEKRFTIQRCVLAFPTEEMRDAFYENFKKEIEICKELL